MRLLQVAKRPEIVGGSVGCAWSICQALPGWSHVLFCCWSGAVPRRTRDAFAGHRLLAGPALTSELLREIAPDAILLHNSSDHDLPPELIPDGVPVFYYCHGSYDGSLIDSARLMAASDRIFCVSEYLARQLALESTVLHQPVPSPPAGRARRSARPLCVGRLCNPRSENWHDGLTDFYRELARRCPEVRWELVGCPAGLRDELAEACAGAVAFHPAGLPARRHLWSWHAMLYHSRVRHAYGRTLCEAQRAGCVPVVDRRCGFVEQIEPGRTGFLCETVDDFAAALHELRDPERWSSLSRAAREAGGRRGSLEVWRDRFLQSFEEARSLRRGSHGKDPVGRTDRALPA